MQKNSLPIVVFKSTKNGKGKHMREKYELAK
jgi:hypothetical protein